MKICSKCKEHKELAALSKSSRYKDGLRCNCKKCATLASLQSHAKAYATPVGRERINKASRETKAKPRGREKNKEACAKFYATPEGRAKILAAKAKRRRAYTYPGEESDILAIYLEAQLLEIADGIPRHVDHIVPLNGKNVCGLHVVANLQILTATENMSKGNRYG